MKKSAHIHLVLITAAFSSCAKVIIPNEALDRCPVDSTATHTQVDLDEYPAEYQPPYQHVGYTSFWNFSYIPSGPVYSVTVRNPYYYPGKPPYRKELSWNGNGKAVVVRGGFGITAGTTTIGS